MSEVDKSTSPVLAPYVCKVNHIAFSVKNAEQSFAFYQHILGAKQLHRPKFANPGYWLWLGNVQLHLIENPEKVIVDEFPRAGTNINHLSLECSDLNQCQHRLDDAQIEYHEIVTPTDVAHIRQVRKHFCLSTF